MNERIESEHDTKLRQFHHDIQNCLSVISLGMDVLVKAREDDALFSNFHKTIQEHQRMASKLLDEFLETARKG